MGRTSNSKGDLNRSLLLFDLNEITAEKPEETLPLDTPAVRFALAGKAPAQSFAKARLIEEYLSRFQLVTKGGLYIDGFAGPQKLGHLDAWTAKRILEIQPPRLRTFWLHDLNQESCEHLRTLQTEHDGKPRSRKVFVFNGDFNDLVDGILKSGRIKRRTAVFALLDQRNTECHWATVQKLAAYKGRTRIELLYFLGIGWLHRSLKTSTRPEKIAEINRWWGGEGWSDLKGLSQIQLAETFSERFQRELGYKYSNWWPIYLNDDGQKKAFVLVHATDHDAAPKLMRRAFEVIYGAKTGSPTDPQRRFPGL